MSFDSATFHSGPLAELQASVEAKLSIDDVGASPLKPSAFAEGLPGVDHATLPSDMITRSDLLKHASSDSMDLPTLCAAVMAWGGMHRNNRDGLFKRSPSDWLKVCEGIREGRLDHVEAYDAFRELREANKLKGMGPAFFTKLIYFLPPRPDDVPGRGYIMDQWAGCSVNVLTGRDVVMMNSTATWKRDKAGPVKKHDFIVSDLNTGQNYRDFCECMDKLSAHFGVNPHQIDRAIMSDGGRNPLSWRKYVIEHRKP